MQIRTWGRRWKIGGLVALAALACVSFETPAWAQCNRGGSMGSSYGGMGNPMMAMQMQRMQAMQQMYAMQQQMMMMQQQGGGGPPGGYVPGYGNPGMRGGQFGSPNQVAQDEGGPQMRRGRRPPPPQVARGRNKPPKTAVASKKPAKKSKVASPGDPTVAQRD